MMNRFWQRVAIGKPDWCWPWLGPADNGGYCRVKIDGIKRLVHRVAFEQVNGPIPDGMQIDHLCRNRICCNPSHLEAVTCRENIARGVPYRDREKYGGQHREKTHCPAGHEYTPENTYVYSHRGERTNRLCKACRDERTRKTREAKRNARPVAQGEPLSYLPGSAEDT